MQIIHTVSKFTVKNNCFGIEREIVFLGVFLCSWGVLAGWGDEVTRRRGLRGQPRGLARPYGE